ncbi:DeoR/GlpR family DNA-binding transcription regulator [Pectinatus haikarae]|uniref:DeoR/GlpR family transcriptional regulator of sugar metabolism n=1 Tax=Pectinatus haikarae TaxID=349096 RepID=A0ABT9Y7U6_9FIRM|nr:DeoR/GlpR family DNA-binding transcription regulator [Pectinatus haikarae]MDQ0203277.1 DeoR/GlpR family transcriptional regulator of sugar metabolism [Pectinatus haikarae]
MLGIERRQKIINKMQQERKVYVNELAALFKVTEETIRRDLEKLEKQDFLRRSYGGAVLKEHTYDDISFSKRITLNLEEKQQIAQKACSLINKEDSIMVDASTTCLEVVQLLKNEKSLTWITNSIKIVYTLIHNSAKVIASGGILRNHSYSLTGSDAVNTLNNYCVDIALIGCKGMSMQQGITESNEAESIIKKKMAEQARTIILLADHSKFDNNGFAKTLDFKQINYVITDKQPSAKWASFLKKHNIKLIY